MKKTTSFFTIVAMTIGIIGIIESIVNFSLFQTFISAGLVWGALEFNRDVNIEENGEKN